MNVHRQTTEPQATRSLGPIATAHLFPTLEAELLKLLNSLSSEDWEKQTVASRWKVKDVVAHMLDTQLRKLSACRDGCVPEKHTIGSQAELTELIDSLNERGVSFMRRLSPRVLISLMELASRENAVYHLSLNPMEPACFPVSWAGETESQNWFDTAREFTERWHHQQQIRLATGRDKPGIMRRELYYPVLDCFMRALPFHYRDFSRPAGTVAHFEVAGDCGGSWCLLREKDAWRLTRDAAGERDSHTMIPQEIAWRVFTKGISKESAKAQVQASGDEALGQHILSMISIVG